MNTEVRDRLIAETHKNTESILAQVERNKTNIAWLRAMQIGTIGFIGAVIKFFHSP